MKFCSGCKRNLPIVNFGKDNHRKGGIATRCKECRNSICREYNRKNPEMGKRHNDSRTEWRKTYYSKPEKRLKLRNAHLKKYFNLDHGDYEKMLESQNGVCAICKQYRVASNREHMSIDHCHTTGKIRGVLCTYCNGGLGSFEDNQEFLNNAIKYLKESLK